MQMTGQQGIWVKSRKGMNCSLIVDFAEILHIKELQNGCFLNIFAEKLEICVRTEYYIVNQVLGQKD